MLLAQEAPSRLFRALFSLGPELGTAQENDVEQGSPGRTIAQECEVRSGFDYPPIPDQEELQNGNECYGQKAKKLIPLGKVELRVSAWSCGTPEH